MDECYSSTLNLWFGDWWDDPWWNPEYWEEDKMYTLEDIQKSHKAVAESDRILSIVINKNRPGMKVKPMPMRVIKS
jgi:hypothetical protein